jgi:hypothetical protein
MSARYSRAAILALAIVLGGCSGGSHDATGPDPVPPVQNPEPPVQIPDNPPPNQGVQGTYVLEQINDSKPGQLVTISNPDGKVIGLYRFEATNLSMDALQTFQMALRYSDDKSQFEIDDQGEFKGAGPVSELGAMPLTFYSKVYGDQFTAVVLGDIVAIKYDFDGDGQPDTSIGFRRGD